MDQGAGAWNTRCNKLDIPRAPRCTPYDLYVPRRAPYAPPSTPHVSCSTCMCLISCICVRAYAYVYTRTGAQARALTRQRRAAQEARAVLEARLGRAEHATPEVAARTVWGRQRTPTSCTPTRCARGKALRRSPRQQELRRSPRLLLPRASAPVNLEVQVQVQVVVQAVRVEAARPRQACRSKSCALTARREAMAVTAVDCSRLFRLRHAPAQEPRQRRTEGGILPLRLQAGWSRARRRGARGRMGTRQTWRSWARWMWARR